LRIGLVVCRVWSMFVGQVLDRLVLATFCIRIETPWSICIRVVTSVKCFIIFYLFFTDKKIKKYQIKEEMLDTILWMGQRFILSFPNGLLQTDSVVLLTSFNTCIKTTTNPILVTWITWCHSILSFKKYLIKESMSTYISNLFYT